MCGKKTCQKPEELTGKPEECSPEQIRRCHGDVKGHPCVEVEAGSSDCDKKEGDCSGGCE